MPYPQEQTWEIIRINASAVGWDALIAQLKKNHVVALTKGIAHPQQDMIHDFYEKAATPEERKIMLQNYFQPRC